MSSLTPELVQSFYHDACTSYGAHVKSKSDSGMMVAVANFLDLIGVQDKEMFLNRFTTTIFDTIYAPYEVGVDGSAGYSLWEQITTLVHELTHVTQHDADRLGFWMKYLADKSARAHYEAQAYGADLEMHIWRYGAPYDLAETAGYLQYYGLQQQHIDFAYAELQTIADVIQNTDGAVSPVAAYAMTWLEQWAPDLKYTA
jgi:hypothetical protein